jgi:hypothetical protein
LKTVAEQAKDNNPQVKKVIIEPIEKSSKANGITLTLARRQIGSFF